MDGSKAPMILVVDDDEDYREVMRLILEREGYQTSEATNGVHAVQLAQQIQPALILMDLSMPVLDGKLAAEQIRQEPALRGVPIIFCSGFGELGMDLYLSIDSLGYSPVEYLAKPLSDFPELMKLIGDLLDRGESEGPTQVGDQLQ
jgi:two-component system alkaline phosphatase synthesis response regulator PhoP